MTIKGIKESVVLGCEAKNQAGYSVRVFSNIGVIPLGNMLNDDFILKLSQLIFPL